VPVGFDGGGRVGPRFAVHPATYCVTAIETSVAVPANCGLIAGSYGVTDSYR